MGQAGRATAASSSLPSAGEHVLLTVLGTSRRSTCYELEGRTLEAELAPAALLELLPDSEKPSRILALCPPEAKSSSLPALEDALGDRYPVEQVSVSVDGSPEDQVNGYLEEVTRAVGSSDKVTIDVTHGFRHFSFLMYVAVLYLAALRNTKICGAYYGLLSNDDSPSPFIDLRPLLKLQNWIYALKVMEETGSTLPLAKIVENSTNSKGPLNHTIAKELRNLSQAYLSGLPIELGRGAQTFRQDRRRPLGRMLKNDRLPCRKELIDYLDNILAPFEIDCGETPDGKWKKEMVELDDGELKRQAAIIDRLFQHENLDNALGLLQEWTISWVVWNNGHKERWLDYKKERKSAANQLNMVNSICKDNALNINLRRELRELGQYWEDLSVRNGYAHHGMRPQLLVGDKKATKSKQQLDRILKYWRSTLQRCPRISLQAVPEGGWVLVSPMGMTSGVLFSALRVLQEDGGKPLLRCLVVCSAQTQGKIAEAVERAGYDMAKVVPLCLEDPHGGTNEIERLEKVSRHHLIDATEVAVNVTGGTTLMGLAVQALAGTAQDLARPVRRFGLIDQRPSEQQRADPYKMGEVFWIDRPDSEDADGN